MLASCDPLNPTEAPSSPRRNPGRASRLCPAAPQESCPAAPRARASRPSPPGRPGSDFYSDATDDLSSPHSAARARRSARRSSAGPTQAALARRRQPPEPLPPLVQDLAAACWAILGRPVPQAAAGGPGRAEASGAKAGGAGVFGAGGFFGRAAGGSGGIFGGDSAPG